MNDTMERCPRLLSEWHSTNCWGPPHEEHTEQCVLPKGHEGPHLWSDR